ncbi:hypothetical protein [Catenulispora subtropica]
MRKLLSDAIPAPEDEPHQRDVISAAMAWGERRRRLDWVLTGAATLAVVAVGAGVAVLGTGSGPGTSAASGGADSQKTLGGMLDSKVVNGQPFQSFSPTCMPPPNLPGGQTKKYCDLWQEQVDWSTEFAKGSVPYIQAKLPQGFTVKAANSYVVQLTAPDGKTNLLFPSAGSAANLLGGHTPSCAHPGDDCTQTSAGGGHGVIGQYPSEGQSAEWVADGLKDPVILLGVNVVGTSDVGGLPAPTGGRLLSADDITRIVSNPDYVKYAKESWKHEEEIRKQLLQLQGPSPTDGPTGQPSATGSGMPSGGGTGSSPVNWPPASGSHS